MALSEIETARAKKTLGEFIERRRPPPHIREQLGFAYRITGQSVELLEVRPVWDRPSEKMERPFAKATFVRTQGLWRIYWHLYEPAPEVAGLPGFLSVVEEDAYGCFWG